MQQKELKKTVDDKIFCGATSINKGDHHVLRVSFISDDPDVMIRTARGGVRKFKTLDYVKRVLEEAGIHSWLVR